MKKILIKYLNTQGLTVLELLVALSLITFIVGGGFTIMTQGSKLFDTSNEQTNTRISEKLALRVSEDSSGIVWNPNNTCDPEKEDCSPPTCDPTVEKCDIDDQINCYSFVGNFSWDQIKSKLGLSKNEKVPENTTIIIDGSLTTTHNNSSGGKHIIGANKDTVKIYINKDFSPSESNNGTQIEGVTIYVKGEYNKKGHVKNAKVINEDFILPKCNSDDDDEEEQIETPVNPIDNNCLFFEGETRWSQIRTKLGLTNNNDRIPANTTIYIDGNLTMDGNSSNNGKKLYGESKDSVRIYVNGNFTTDSGSKIGGVTMVVYKTFDHKKGEVESSAKIYVGHYQKANSAKDHGNVVSDRTISEELLNVPQCVLDYLKN